MESAGMEPEERNMVVEVMIPEMIAILQRKTEAQRLEIAWGMWRSARDMLTCLLRAEHPDWPDTQIRREVARRMAHGT